MVTNSFIGVKSVSTQQWESGNVGTAYPFDDDSLPDGFPNGVIVDACIVLPSTIQDRPVLSCLHRGPSLVSAMVLVGGRPALYAAVSKAAFVPFSPVVMESSIPGVSGMITFGNPKFDAVETVRGSFVFSEAAVVRPRVGRLERFYDPETGATASGYVGLELPDGVSVSIEEEGHESRMSFSTNDEIRQSVLAPCAKYERPNDSPQPIMSINGVRPDEDGRIAIVFTHDESEVPR